MPDVFHDKFVEATAALHLDAWLARLLHMAFDIYVLFQWFRVLLLFVHNAKASISS
jgi:uncharacterized membrane protein YcgQ (UPF0703/DUF1980 family)